MSVADGMFKQVFIILWFCWLHRAAPYGEILCMHVSESSGEYLKELFKTCFDMTAGGLKLKPHQTIFDIQMLNGF